MSDINSDSKVRDLEHEVEEKEREIQMLRDSIHDYNNLNPVSEERAKAMERRLDEVDSLVKGLMQEVLDVKACLQKISKSLDENPVPGRRGGQIKGQKGSRNYPPVVAPSAAAEKKAAASPETAEKEPSQSKEKLIIQPDGTMKPEVQSGDEMIIADHRAGRQAQAGRKGDPLDKKPLIYAEDDDSIEIKRKNYRK